MRKLGLLMFITSYALSKQRYKKPRWSSKCLCSNFANHQNKDDQQK